LYTGKKKLGRPTQIQCCRVADANLSYVNAFLTATPEERLAVRRGALTLSALCHQRKLSTHDDIKKDIKKYVGHVGLAAVYEVIAEIIASPVAAAAE
jgi:hypothetical protein